MKYFTSDRSYLIEESSCPTSQEGEFWTALLGLLASAKDKEMMVLSSERKLDDLWPETRVYEYLVRRIRLTPFLGTHLRSTEYFLVELFVRIICEWSFKPGLTGNFELLYLSGKVLWHFLLLHFRTFFLGSILVSSNLTFFLGSGDLETTCKVSSKKREKTSPASCFNCPYCYQLNFLLIIK